MTWRVLLNMSKKIYEIHADICKTLGNAKRIEILSALENRELTVSELVNILGISPRKCFSAPRCHETKGYSQGEKKREQYFLQGF